MFQLKVYTSKYFLLKLEEFKLFTLEDFGNDIDVESYLFFKAIIYQKASQIITDLRVDEINKVKEMPSDKIAGHENEKVIRYFKAYKNNIIKSDNGLIQKLRNQEENLSHDELPHYLLLGSVSEGICIEIEKRYGIICYSLNRLKVRESVRKVCLYKIENTSKALYSKLNETSFNSIHINDPFFFTKAFGGDNMYRQEVINDLLKRRDNLFCVELKVKLTTALENRTLHELKNWGSQFAIELQAVYQEATFTFAEANKKDGKQHDRYVFTNQHINVMGNSFFSTSNTHYTSYPIGIYGDYLTTEL